jgi:Tfp pilus assembly protein FimT
MRRTAFSLIELLIALATVGAMMLIALPKFERARASASLRSAKNTVVSQIAAARATAIRRGAYAYFVRSGNTIRVEADSANVRLVVLRSAALDTAYQVAVASTYDTIRYDMRGTARVLATGVIISGVKYTITRGALRDSVCVSSLGMVSLRACGL